MFLLLHIIAYKKKDNINYIWEKLFVPFSLIACFYLKPDFPHKKINCFCKWLHTILFFDIAKAKKIYKHHYIVGHSKCKES